MAAFLFFSFSCICFVSFFLNKKPKNKLNSDHRTHSFFEHMLSATIVIVFLLFRFKKIYDWEEKCRQDLFCRNGFRSILNFFYFIQHFYWHWHQVFSHLKFYLNLWCKNSIDHSVNKLLKCRLNGAIIKLRKIAHKAHFRRKEKNPTKESKNGHISWIEAIKSKGICCRRCAPWKIVNWMCFTLIEINLEQTVLWP